MNIKNRLNLRQLRLSAISAATALIGVGLAGCGGHDESTTLTVSGAGNSPFVGVEMTATCANGASGKAIIGSIAAPGDGVITITEDCAPPIKLKATGKGKMRPIGGNLDGSQDVAYDPAFNLPISNIFDAPPAEGSSVTANPVTSLIDPLVASGSTVEVAKSKIETSMAMPTGTTNKDYRIPDISRASTQLAAIAALAVKTLKTTTASQEVLAELASSVAVNKPLTDAQTIAAAVKTKTDVTTDPAFSENEINNDAARVFNMLVAVQGLGASQPQSIPTTWAEISKAVSEQPDSALHIAVANKLAAVLTYAQAVVSETNPVALAAAEANLQTAVETANSTLGTANSTTLTTTSTTVPPTTTTTTAPTTTSTTAPTTTSTTAPTTTSTTATTTTTTIAVTFSGICEIKVGSAIGYMTGVPNAGTCRSSVVNVDGGGATVAVAPATLLTNKTSVSFASALTCDPFGAPPAAGATTLTPCKL